MELSGYHFLVTFPRPVAQLVEHRVVVREVVSSTPSEPTLRVFKKLRRECCLCNYISKWFDFQVFSDKDYKPEVPSHNSFNSKILWDVQEATHLSKRVEHEVPSVVAALFSKMAGSKYTCKRLRVYEGTKKMCEQPLVRRWFSSAETH